ETIHPFLDGNGRVGRLLITLFLMEKKVLTTPALYISYFLKKNRVEYYDRMTEVRLKGNYEQWIRFFLMAIDESARDAIAAIDEMTVLQAKNREKVRAMGRASKNALLLFEYLASHPIIDIGKTAEALDLSYNTVSAAVKRLMDADILVQTENVNRNRTFSYRDYLGILRKGT
ncbi:MAG: Fic family protein, partial [Ruminococcaceae bacterium]|nr:Fic family protein [Oscillospiraceae bacterium]